MTRQRLGLFGGSAVAEEQQSDRDGRPETYFAPPERATAQELGESIRVSASSELLQTILKLFGSIVAVLDEHRQVVAVSDGLLRFLGVEKPEELLGLRPGEAFDCAHTEDHPGGCGTSRFCSSCGAAIAIVLAQQTLRPAERECLLSIRSDPPTGLELLARATPLEADSHRFVVLVLQDIRSEKLHQTLERVFFHDLRNGLQGLQGLSRLLKTADAARQPALAEKLAALTELLSDEVRSQQIITQAEAGDFLATFFPVSAAATLVAVQETFERHPVARERLLQVSPPAADVMVLAEPALLQRVLVNLVKNALEATPAGSAVRVWCDCDEESVTWRVHNREHIPDAVAMRVFQRYFSTKPDPGRGLGTYAAKLLGEHYLGGKVSFTTSAEEGTVFSFSLPRDAVAGHCPQPAVGSAASGLTS